MLTRLILENFQAHEELALDLDPQGTTIVGPTDTGKSAVVRALRFLIHNKPAGDSFIRDGADSARIILAVDGHTVVRERGKGVNRYAVDGKEFKAFGNTVPEEIQYALNIPEEAFQLQLDSPFWFGESSSELSRKLNAVINLGDIDSALSRAATLTRHARSELEVSESRLAAIEKDVVDLEDVPRFLSQLRRLKAKNALLEQTRLERSSLDDHVAAVKRLRREAEDAVNAKAEAEKLERLGSRLEVVRTEMKTLRESVARYRAALRATRVPVPDDIDKVLAIRKEADAVAEERRTLEAAVERLKAADEKVQTINEELASWQAKLAKLESEVPRCPECGQSLKPTPPSSRPAYSSRTST